MRRGRDVDLQLHILDRSFGDACTKQLLPWYGLQNSNILQGLSRVKASEVVAYVLLVSQVVVAGRALLVICKQVALSGRLCLS
jgi:hypothetical protein